MKLVCYAAGKNIECRPHTVNRPAALLRILGQSVIEHNLSALSNIDEYIIITGFEGRQIVESLGSEFQGKPVSYFEVSPDAPLPDCFKLFGEKVKDQNIIFMICESVFSPADIVRVAENPGSRLMKGEQACCLLHLTAGQLKQINSGEPLQNIAAKMEQIQVEDYWHSLKYPWNYLEANVELVRRLTGQEIKGKVEQGASISGPVYIGPGTVIKPFTCIEGPAFIDADCTIGPFAYIRKDTVICKKVQLGRMEVFDSVLMDGFTSKHVSYAAHSVIGANGNFGAGTITADYRHDGGNHITLITGEKVNTGRRKLGAFLGDKVHTAIGTLIYPGRKMWPGTSTLPGEVLQKDRTE
ncbi:MAG: hypothetical protein JXM68_01380 [Sedimentisphaerales bacterium]|nr:hypothetical protein [Sedimentisphaerales bacterium]